MSIKTDKKLKDQAQKIAKNMGFPLGTLLNAYMRQLVINKVVYFSSQPTYFMSDYLESELTDIEKDIVENKNISPGFKDIKEALDYLHQPE